jgi:hypothetical protein
MFKKIIPWLGGGIIVFALSWYLAIKFAIVLIATVIGFFAGFSYGRYKNGKK